eukprot:3684690-Rhodomonas_salina.2
MVLPAYARPTPCPVLTWRMARRGTRVGRQKRTVGHVAGAARPYLLRQPYAKSGTPYGKSGTDRRCACGRRRIRRRRTRIAPNSAHCSPNTSSRA